jgi:hypothetical protein
VSTILQIGRLQILQLDPPTVEIKVCELPELGVLGVICIYEPLYYIHAVRVTCSQIAMAVTIFAHASGCQHLATYMQS